MTTPTRNSPKSKFEIEANHDNTSQEIIRTTADKLKLVLIEHLNKVENAKSWQTPFSIIVTIVLVFCSADFRVAFGLPADTWRALFIFSLVGCVAWLIYSLVRYGRSPTLASIIAKIKNSDE
jgi:hypothetical protein